MKDSILLMCLMGALARAAFGQAGIDSNAVTKVEQLLSAHKVERENALTQMEKQLRETRAGFAANLEKAIKQHRGDARYMSPLHVAIQAAAHGRAFETEDTLLTIIDYQLDTSSIPVGFDLSGDDLYPAASALVRLRVDTKKVLRAMEVTGEERKLRLLLWVLYIRLGSVEETRRALATEGVASTTVLALLDKAPDLLPPLSGK